MDAACDLDRARAYRWLARWFQPPQPGTVAALRAQASEVLAALARLGGGNSLRQRAQELAGSLDGVDDADLQTAWSGLFEPEGGLACSPNETSHTAATPQEAWLKTYRLADIAGFYRAFGVEVTPGTEKVDHVGVEVEFMHLLAVKAAAAAGRGNAEQEEICRQAAAAFLADHLGRWCDGLAARLRDAAGAGPYPLAAELLRDVVAADRARLGPPPEPEPQTPQQRLEAFAARRPVS